MTSSLRRSAHSARTFFDYRAHRGQARIKSRLIGDRDPDLWELPPKPKWMRWSTYCRLEERFDHYKGILDGHLIGLMDRLEALEAQPG